MWTQRSLSKFFHATLLALFTGDTINTILVRNTSRLYTAVYTPAHTPTNGQAWRVSSPYDVLNEEKSKVLPRAAVVMASRIYLPGTDLAILGRNIERLLSPGLSLQHSPAAVDAKSESVTCSLYTAVRTEQNIDRLPSTE